MFVLGVIPIIAFLLLYLVSSRVNFLRDSDHREVFLAASLIWGLLIVVSTEILSLGGVINFKSVLGFWIGVNVVLAGIYLNQGGRIAVPTFRGALPKLSGIEIAMGIAIALIVLIVGMVAFMAPPNSWDALNYHMSRVLFWQQNQSVGHYPTPEFRQLFFQPFGSYAFLHFQILAGSDRFAPLISYFSFLGCIVGLSLIAFLLGASRFGQIFAAFFVATIPTAIVEASGVRIDTIAAYWIICFVALLLSFRRNPKIFTTILLGVNLGLGILTKGTIHLIIPPILLWFLFVLFRRVKFARALKWLMIFGVVALVVNLGFFTRNFLLSGSILGPADMRKWGLTYDMTFALVISNVMRTIFFQLGNAIPLWNKMIVTVVHGVHDFLRIDTLDLRSTISNTPFDVSVSVHEDGVTNFVQTVLILISMVWVFVVSLKEKTKPMILYVVTIVVSFVILNSTIRWTNHITRYNLPLFILCGAVVAFCVERYFQHKKIILWFLVVSLAATSMPYVFRNNLRRVVSSKKQTIFNTARYDQYFRNDISYLQPYQKASERIASLGCDHVGLYMGFNSWDYPLMVTIREKLGPSIRMEHLLINQYCPDQYPLGAFVPCAVITVDQNTDKLELKEGRPLQRIANYGKTAVFVREDAGRIVEDVTPKVKRLAF